MWLNLAGRRRFERSGDDVTITTAARDGWSSGSVQACCLAPDWNGQGKAIAYGDAIEPVAGSPAREGWTEQSYIVGVGVWRVSSLDAHGLAGIQHVAVYEDGAVELIDGDERSVIDALAKMGIVDMNLYAAGCVARARGEDKESKVIEAERVERGWPVITGSAKQIAVGARIRHERVWVMSEEWDRYLGWLKDTGIEQGEAHGVLVETVNRLAAITDGNWWCGTRGSTWSIVKELAGVVWAEVL